MIYQDLFYDTEKKREAKIVNYLAIGFSVVIKLTMNLARYFC